MNMRRPLVLFANLLLKSAALTLLIFSVAPVSAAETFPDKPVSLMVPYPAGGLSDVIARFVNMPLSKQLGQPVIVENLGGASGSIAAQKLLNSPADGYRIFQGSPNELILAPLAMKAVKFKSEEFKLVQMIGSAQIAVLARKDLPVSNMDEFVIYARKQAELGKPITYASVGVGSFYHLLGEHLSKVTGVPMLHVPFKGGAPAAQAVMSGEVDIFLSPYGKSYDEQSKSGLIKILAMLNQERLEGVKQYPAIGESKELKNFIFTIWTGYFVPQNTPEAVVNTLYKAITASLEDPAVRNGLTLNSLLIAPPLSQAEVARVYAEGVEKFRAIAKSIDLQPE
jgi:tripartite-type tricarboxylate transporter receptor subunit TctC